MRNKGYTLVELLGVIVIIALLSLLVFPSIINTIKKSSDNIDNKTLELIYNASDIYVSRHLNDFPKLTGSTSLIHLESLIAEDLLPNDEKITQLSEKCVEVTYDQEYSYELVECY